MLMEQRPTNHRDAQLWCLLTAVFMAILDVTVANIALPSIQHNLRTSGPQLQFVTAGYIAAYAVLLVPGARLGSMFGYRRLFLAGLTLFTTMSLLCGAAPTIGLLIFFRVLQGVGAALFMPQVISMIQRDFERAERARALSRYATVIAIAAIVGQILGGLLVSSNIFGLEWRTVFLINVPVGLTLLILSARLLPKQETGAEKYLDPVGILWLALALVTLVLPITLGYELGWPTWTWVSLSVSLAALVAFATNERRAERSGKDPLISSRLLRTTGFSAGAAAILLALAGYGGILFTITIYVQNGLHLGPLATGLTFLPGAISFGAASIQWRRLPAGWHAFLAPIGLGIACLSFVGLALSAQSAAISATLEIAIFGFGLGMGLTFSPIFALILSRVAPANAADASGVLTTANQLGQVLGVAAYGALLLTISQSTGSIPYAATITAFVMAGGSLVAGIFAWLAARSK